MQATTDDAFALWRDARPVIDWLDAHVGPSTIPPHVRYEGRSASAK